MCTIIESAQSVLIDIQYMPSFIIKREKDLASHITLSKRVDRVLLVDLADHTRSSWRSLSVLLVVLLFSHDSVCNLQDLVSAYETGTKHLRSSHATAFFEIVTCSVLWVQTFRLHNTICFDRSQSSNFDQPCIGKASSHIKCCIIMLDTRPAHQFTHLIYPLSSCSHNVHMFK